MSKNIIVEEYMKFERISICEVELGYKISGTLEFIIELEHAI